MGCKVNQYETQLVKEALESNGYREARADEPADLCIVNSCTVTHEADAKTRQLLRRLHRTHPQSALVVMGCYATRDPDAVARLPGVARVVTHRERLDEALAEYGVKNVPARITRFDGHQRAFVKVQDGCILNCTFCIIPSVRAGLRSRSADEIVQEVRGLIDRGRREIVLTGIHLGHYGIDLSKGKPKAAWMRLWHLIDRLSSLPGEFRIRLSSLEAAEVRDDLVRVLKGNPRVCPHLHLCLQSGSDRILAAMKRRYRVQSFLERCRRLREALDTPAITTDVIVGFPGETDADFEATLAACREAEFAKVHVFPFSRRRGTPAADMPGQISPQVIAERKQLLARLDAELEQSYLQKLVGRRLNVLVETVDPSRPNLVSGTSCRKATVWFPVLQPGLGRSGGNALKGQLMPVWATRVEEGRLWGEPAADGVIPDGLEAASTSPDGGGILTMGVNVRTPLTVLNDGDPPRK